VSASLPQQRELGRVGAPPRPRGGDPLAGRSTLDVADVMTEGATSVNPSAGRVRRKRRVMPRQSSSIPYGLVM